MKITPAIAIFFANIIIQPLLWGHASHSHDNDSEPLKDSVSLKSGELELELHLNPDDLQIEGTREAKVGDIEPSRFINTEREITQRCAIQSLLLPP